MHSGQLIQLSSHSYLYRGFTIQKYPRDYLTKKYFYGVMHQGEYFGRDYALAEAICTIDKMYCKLKTNSESEIE
ncbi:TPA: DUF4761 domain-containing protein [Yersinia enterocolitica]|nr:DUF4761 domain-containing protein [Yersinia enterocolitica]